MATGRAAFLGLLIYGMVQPALAAAEAIPIPRPAPRPKVVEAAPPPTAEAAIKPPLSLGQDVVVPVGKPPVPAPGETIAFDANQRVLADRISTYLSNMRTLVGDFVQVGPDGSRTQGQVYLQKPGRVRFEYDEPSPIELVSDGSSVVVRDRKLATQDLYPLSQTPLRFILADKVDILKDTNVVGIYSDDVFSTVVIDEKTLGGVHRLMMMFAARDLTLRQWTITDPQGYDTTVAVYNLDTTKRPDPSLFKINYQIPERSSN